MNLQVIDFQHKYHEYKLEDNLLNTGIRASRLPHTEILDCILSQHTDETT